MVSIFSNPLATPLQLASSPSQTDGIPEVLEIKLRTAGCSLIQAAGILLQLPQPTIATAIVLFQRFYLIVSMRQHCVKDSGQAALFLASKTTEHPQRPRDIINVYAYLLSPSSPLTLPSTTHSSSLTSFHVSESRYLTQRSSLLRHETLILKSLGFQTHVALPYTLAFNYLKSLSVLTDERNILERTFAHLNDFLCKPAVVYLTHHVSEIAVAGIYLAAKEVGIRLPERWWEVWDVDREVLGFLVVVGRVPIEEVYVGEGKKSVGDDVVMVDFDGLEEELYRMKRREDV